MAAAVKGLTRPTNVGFMAFARMLAALGCHGFLMGCCGLDLVDFVDWFDGVDTMDVTDKVAPGGIKVLA